MSQLAICVQRAAACVSLCEPDPADASLGVVGIVVIIASSLAGLFCLIAGYANCCMKAPRGGETWCCWGLLVAESPEFQAAADAENGPQRTNGARKQFWGSGGFEGSRHTTLARGIAANSYHRTMAVFLIASASPHPRPPQWVRRSERNRVDRH